MRWKNFIRLERAFMRDYASVIIGMCLGRGLSFAAAVVLARRMSVEDFGLFSLYFTILMLVWQLPQAMDSAYIRYVNSTAAGDDTGYLRAAVAVKGMLVAMIVLTSLPFGRFLAQSVFHKPDAASAITSALAAGAALSMFAGVGARYQAREKFLVFSILDALFPVVMFTVIACAGTADAAGRGFSAPTVIGWYSSVAFAFGLAGAVCLYRPAGGFFPVHPGLMSKVLHFGKWIFASSLTYVVFSRLDVLFLARVAGYAELGIYSAAVRIAMIAGLLASGVSQVFMPKACRALQSPAELRRYLKESAAAACFLSAAILAAIVWLPGILSWTMGEQYRAASSAGRVLLAGYIVVIAYTPLYYLFFPSDDGRRIFGVGLVNLITACCLLPIFCAKWGSVGAAWAIGLAYCCTAAYVAFFAGRIIRANFRRTA